MAMSGPVDNSQDRLQSLFEGAKGAKVIKLAITTVLSALASPNYEENVELVRLCTAALEAINGILIEEWAAMKTSAQHLARLGEKATQITHSAMIYAVVRFRVSLI
jgi:hypothetical protein